ncbi:MAG TPA: hypothetical protein VNO55_24720, partial [Polyangia bacterium]|nr:hypothetical protein [Polyangia bacterium]
LWKAHSISNDIDRLIRTRFNPTERDTKQSSLDRYNTAGIVLVAGGAVLGGAALTYYFSSRNAGQTVSVQLQGTGAGAAFLWTSAF